MAGYMLDVIIERFGDFGAESSRRDEFQKHYAAYCCIEMLFDQSISEVICEYGEDIVIGRNGVYELHQVKTKQESVDDWKLDDLIPIIAKSFAMVPYFGSVSKCCFVSNEGATGVLYELKGVLKKGAEYWDTEDRQFFDDFCKHHSSRILKHMKRLDSESVATVEDVNARLLSLEIDTNFHHMEYIADSNARRLRQALERNSVKIDEFTFTDAELQDVYERLMGLVGKATIGRTRHEKTIVKEDVEECFIIPARRRMLYRFPTEKEISSASGKTLMERKLSLGGFGSVFIDSARELMVTTLYKARSWEFGNAPEILEDIRFRIKYICADNYDRVCQLHPSQKELGRLILEEIKKDLPQLVDYYEDCRLPIDTFFLLGIAWELTSECKAYWSQHKVE